ncbi:Uncharacterized membrane protein [Saccharopolyspora shandongensis]|uniref:Uncharacterized membrane protein n=1 Tax=Saccharopolyspora shandongensis TaxID=418495 RepID=A0A1H3SGR2_9PSEU|nr:DUF2306 domain-containing protein [Saccharopolyspora shandongensis]SDZ36785.1 Uncharacterized membrane protein [Saccharopolyspora shandongensis]
MTAKSGARRSARRGWLLLTTAVVGGTALALPYVLLDVDASRIQVRGEAHWILLLVHIFTAAVALVLGPLQFIPALRARRRLHRAVGRAYLLAGVLPAGLTGIPVALLAEHALTRVGLLIPAVGWLVTGALAVRAARRRDFAAHRAWMMRNYALTFLAVTSRILVPLLLLAQFPFIDAMYGGSVPAAVDMTIPIGQWLGWIINLTIVEFLLRRERTRAVPAPQVSPETARRA